MTARELIELLNRYPEDTEILYNDGDCGGPLPIDYVLEEHIDNECNYIVLDCS